MDCWKRIFWSDEAKIYKMGGDGIKYVWLADPQNFQSHIVDETLKFECECVMVGLGL